MNTLITQQTWCSLLQDNVLLQTPQPPADITSSIEGCLSRQWISTSFVTRWTIPALCMAFLSICRWVQQEIIIPLLPIGLQCIMGQSYSRVFGSVIRTVNEWGCGAEGPQKAQGRCNIPTGQVYASTVRFRTQLVSFFYLLLSILDFKQEKLQITEKKRGEIF